MKIEYSWFLKKECENNKEFKQLAGNLLQVLKAGNVKNPGPEGQAGFRLIGYRPLG
jgi:hypothetical protein